MHDARNLMVFDDEIAENLDGNYQIIQKKNGFRFGTDAVLLARFSENAVCSSMLDLCTGSGIVPLLFSMKNDCPNIHGLEIQKDIAFMAERSVGLNRLDDRIKITCGDLNEWDKYYKKRSFDVITCNPPYIKAGAGLKSDNDTKIISRHEVFCNLEDVIRVSSMLLKQRGHFYIVHKPSRLADIFYFMRKYNIEPKRMKSVYAGMEKPPSLVLVEGVFGAKSDLRIESPVIL